MAETPPPLKIKTEDEVDLKELQRKRDIALEKLDRIGRMVSPEPGFAPNPFLHYSSNSDLLCVSRLHSSLLDLAPPQMTLTPMSTLRRQAVVDILPLWGGGVLGL